MNQKAMKIKKNIFFITFYFIFTLFFIYLLNNNVYIWFTYMFTFGILFLYINKKMIYIPIYILLYILVLYTVNGIYILNTKLIINNNIELISKEFQDYSERKLLSKDSECIYRKNKLLNTLFCREIDGVIYKRWAPIIINTNLLLWTDNNNIIYYEPKFFSNKTEWKVLNDNKFFKILSIINDDIWIVNECYKCHINN